jgi:phage terminase large subunit GpA-like protein
LIGDSRVKWLIAIAPTQSGKTVLLQVSVADTIDQDPGPGLYLLPDQISSKKNLQEKIINMITSSPALAAHMTGRVRDISKTEIELDNMTIYPGWAGSLGTTSSLPMKRVWIDEARLMGLTVGNESNAIQTGEDRLTTYFKAGIGQGIIVSSPSVVGDLLHSQLDAKGTSIWAWAVPCPACRKYQRLDFFKNVKIKDDVKCVCKFCGAGFTDLDDKREWNNKGMYMRLLLNDNNELVETEIDEDGNAEYPFEVTPRMAFMWDSLVSPFRTFYAIGHKYLETKDKLYDYKHFIQCWLARFWIDDISKTTVTNLKSHCKGYSKKDVPAKVKVLFTGIDTQDNGFYCVTRGHGANKFTALVDEFFCPCPIDIADERDIIKIITRDIMDRVYVGEKGESWKIAMAAIDTGGHRTKTIYRVATNFPKLIMVKGRDNQSTTYSYNKELNLYLVRTSEYLEETEKKCESPSWWLPENISTDYLTQFVAVRKIREKNKKTGTETIIWKKIGKTDYRMADIHTFIPLDIPSDDYGVLRSRIEEDVFVLNPAMQEKKQAEIRSESSTMNVEEQEDDFVNISGGWL